MKKKKMLAIIKDAKVLLEITNSHGDNIVYSAEAIMECEGIEDADDKKRFVKLYNKHF